MARYKLIDTRPRFLAVDLHKHLLPGSLAHAVNHRLDHDFDLSSFDARYRSDAAGACGFSVLRKPPTPVRPERSEVEGGAVPYMLRLQALCA